MATHVLSFKNKEEFFQRIKDRDRDLIVKMVKTILFAIKHKRPKVDVFDVVFTEVKHSQDLKELIFTKHKEDYVPTLKATMKDLIRFEEYELCAEIKQILEKKKNRNSKEKIKNPE
jgi:hypothetical protein